MGIFSLNNKKQPLSTEQKNLRLKRAEINRVRSLRLANSDPIVDAIDSNGRAVKALRSETIALTCTRGIPPKCSRRLKSGVSAHIPKPFNNNSLTGLKNPKIVIAGRLIETVLNGRLGAQVVVEKPTELNKNSTNLVQLKDKGIISGQRFDEVIEGRNTAFQLKFLDQTARDKTVIPGTLPVPLAAQPADSENSTARFGKALQPTVRERAQGAKTKTRDSNNALPRSSKSNAATAGAFTLTGTIPASCGNAVIDGDPFIMLATFCVVVVTAITSSLLVRYFLSRKNHG